MKIIHGSLTALLHEVKERSVEVVRVAAFLQGSDVVSNGIPRYTAWWVVTARLNWSLWTEWRLLVGRGYAEVTEHGAAVPARLAELQKSKTREIRACVTEAGLSVRDGILANDTEAMDRCRVIAMPTTGWARPR
jgi:hypothetical protein